MDLKYLKHLAKKGSTFIHPKGFEATDLLISKLNIQPSDKILEIGCGTGGTLAEVAGRYHINIQAVEILDEMIGAAKVNLKTAGIDKFINIHKIFGNEPYPFASNSFDKIYSESVIGFQDSGTMEFIFKEIRRLLKPGGICVINDALWKKGIPDEEVNKIVSSSIKDFGLAHASPSNIDIDGFIKIAAGCGLKIMEIICLDNYFVNSNNINKPNLKTAKNFLSTGIIDTVVYKFKLKKHAEYSKNISSYIIVFSAE